MTIEIALFSLANCYIDTCWESTLSDLENADDVVLLSENPSNLKVSSDYLRDSLSVCDAVSTFEVWIAQNQTSFSRGKMWMK